MNTETENILIKTIVNAVGVCAVERDENGTLIIEIPRIEKL